ncbi:MAG: hypothetical protein KDA17_07320, partial [Candidatus Saccharibacteria bacterium]|nr:hypothetical protein [Candidatus Saccharibacteria bacterium]
FPRMVVLIDGETQSSAEVLAATLKKYHVGVLVGTASKGWGTVERVFPLEHQLSDTTTYSVFLVHSLTLDDTGNTIQGVGVQPDVRTTDANWQRQLERYYADQTLADSVTQVLTQPAQ